MEDWYCKPKTKEEAIEIVDRAIANGAELWEVVRGGNYEGEDYYCYYWDMCNSWGVMRGRTYTGDSDTSFKGKIGFTIEEVRERFPLPDEKEAPEVQWVEITHPSDIKKYPVGTKVKVSGVVTEITKHYGTDDNGFNTKNTLPDGDNIFGHSQWDDGYKVYVEAPIESQGDISTKTNTTNPVEEVDNSKEDTDGVKTPFEDTGWDKDGLFEVITDDDSYFSKGSIVKLYKDDGSKCPLFSLVEGDCSYNHCRGKPGAYANLSSLKPYKQDPWESGELGREEGYVEKVVIDKVQESLTENVTGGSSPSYYRKSLSLPQTKDRNQYHDVDLEAGDVSQAWNLDGDEMNILKSLLRGDNKEGVDEKYANDKILWFGLRKRLSLGIITHQQFWQMAVALGLSKEV